MPFLLHRGSGSLRDRAPLIVFLHGSGEGGNTVRTLDRMLVHSLPWIAANDRLPTEAAPFLVACPQTSRKLWKDEAARIIELMDELCRREDADPTRCYLTGVSKGGGGCWDVAAAAPDRIAAVLPISGQVRVAAQNRARPPVWLFHGGHDDTNRANQALQRLRDGREEQAPTRVTIDPAAGHDPAFWNRIYMRGDIYSWLLEHATPARMSS